MKKRLLPLVAIIGLVGCSPTRPGIPATIPPVSSPRILPTSIPTAEPTCPEPTEGTLLLRNEDMGYCLLYPDDLFRVDPFAAEVCLVPELPAMACHSNVMQIEVSDAAGLSASEVADAVVSPPGTDIERSVANVAGEDAVILHGVPAQDILRDVLIVHEGRLYKLRFVLPDPADPSAVDRFDRLNAMIIASFTFLPRPQ